MPSLGGPGDGAGGQDPASGVFSAAESPAHGHAVLEAAQAASAVVSAQTGATLSATAASGTRYTLTLPPGALLSDQTITMTPVSSVGNSPLGALVGAVDLEPNGLQLLKPATLTIVPPGPVDAAHVAAFSAAGGGHDFGLVPLNRGKAIVMTLEHFSTDGAADASAAELKVAALDEPSDPEAQWEQVIALDTHAGALNPSAIEADGIAYYRDVALPMANRALTDDSYADSAVAALSHWNTEVQALGLASDADIESLFGTYTDFLIRIMRNAVNQRYQRCIKKDDLSELVRLLGTEHQAAVLNVDLGGASDYGEKCGHFQLTLTTAATETRNTGDQIFHAQIGVENDMSLAVGAFGLPTGDAAPIYTNWQFSVKYGSGVTAGPTEVDTPSTATLAFKYNIMEQTNPKTGQITRGVPAPAVILAFDPGKTKEFWSDPAGTFNFTVWNDVWAEGHLLEVPPFSEGTFQLENWQTYPPGSGSLIATKTYPTHTFCRVLLNCNPATSYDTITETTTLKLYHRPQ